MPYSQYSKMHDLLRELSAKEEAVEINGFAEEIHNKQIESFAIWRRAEGSDSSIKTYCSTTAIRRLIRFAAELELIEIHDQRRCELTPMGANALQADNYPTQLAAQVVKYLREKAGITYEECAYPRKLDHELRWI